MCFRFLALSVTLLMPVGAWAGNLDAWVGNWTGVVHERSSHFTDDVLVSGEFRATASGLVFFDHDRQRVHQDPIRVTLEGRTARMSWHRLFPVALQAQAELSRDGNTIAMHISGDGMTGLEAYHLTLRRSNPEATAFLSARRHSAPYAYQPPIDRNDGLDVATLQSAGLKVKPFEQLVDAIGKEQNDLRSSRTESVLVLRDGRLVFEHYFWGKTIDDAHIISSCTKSVTAILASIAVDEGRLGLDARAASYLPNATKTLWVTEGYPITVRNVLSMTTGTQWYEADSKGGAQPAYLLLETNDVVPYIMNTRLVQKPGTHFNYDSGLPTLAGVMISNATGEPYAKFANRALLSPLGITNYRWTWLKQGIPLAAGGFYITPREMAKIGQMMLDGGVWKGRRIVSEKMVHEMTSQQTEADDYPYGLYWHLSNARKRHIDTYDAYMALGQGGQIIAVLPQVRMVIVFTSANWTESRLEERPFQLIDRYIIPAIEAQ